jgi:alpha-beta hydrolase superfamily lysophospholipase
MSEPSGKVTCPDCSTVILRKNVVKHYRRNHPGLDPRKRMKESKEETRITKPRFEATNSKIAGVLVVIVVVILIIVAGLVMFSLINEDGSGTPDRRTVFFSASDHVVINASWYQSSRSQAETIYLIHDIGGDRTIWDDYARELQSEGYNVMAIDMRGHGESTKNLFNEEIVYDWTTMGHLDFIMYQADIQAAYDWVHGEDNEGEPNTDAGSDGGFIGIGRGGIYGMNKFARMSREERIMSGVVLSPLLFVPDPSLPNEFTNQVFQDWGDIRPIMMAASDGDGTGGLAIDTIMTQKTDDGETNGDGVYVPGSSLGINLLRNKDLKERILLQFEASWGLSPG